MMKIKQVYQIIEQTAEKRSSNFVLVDSNDKLPKYASQAFHQVEVCVHGDSVLLFKHCFAEISVRFLALEQDWCVRHLLSSNPHQSNEP